MFFNPTIRNILPITLMIRNWILGKPPAKEFFHCTSVTISEVNLSQIIPVVEE